jgi:hypothetical protein
MIGIMSHQSIDSERGFIMRSAGIVLGLLGCAILVLPQQQALAPAAPGELAKAAGGACYVCDYFWTPNCSRDPPYNCMVWEGGSFLKIWSGLDPAFCAEAEAHVPGQTECEPTTPAMCDETYHCTDMQCNDCEVDYTEYAPSECAFSGEGCVGE